MPRTAKKTSPPGGTARPPLRLPRAAAGAHDDGPSAGRNSPASIAAHGVVRRHRGVHVRRAEQPGLLIEERASPLLEVDLEELTRWAIEGPYPEDLDEATPTDAARAVELAGQVTALARRALGEEKADGGP